MRFLTLLLSHLTEAQLYALLGTPVRRAARQGLRRKIFPRSLRREFDTEIEPLVTANNDYYLFGDGDPHEHLLRQFDSVIPYLRGRKTGKNFLELGVGVGGASYTARCLGFDVTATDFGGGVHAPAGRLARRLLGIEPQEFLYRSGSTLADVVSFSDGRKADVIYLAGVPFNRKIGQDGQIALGSGRNFIERSRWYGVSEWLCVLDDVVANLEPGGIFVDVGVWGVTRDLAEKISAEAIRKLGDELSVSFRHDDITLPTSDIETVHTHLIVRHRD